MTFNERTRGRLRAHCEEIGEDDGSDPREFFRKTNPKRKGNRKAKQLCRQVAETLELVLSGDCREEILQSLHVVSVDPAPDASRLLVTLQSDLPSDEFDCGLAMERLEQHTGRLRSEVAASIVRKRVPTLAFQVIRPVDLGEDGR
jgi:ribosome-binding factor A